MYPSPIEVLILKEAEKLMVETMARYDPSHDKYHGGCKQFHLPGGESGTLLHIFQCSESEKLRSHWRISYPPQIYWLLSWVCIHIPS
jgi:hypothetical protein